MRVTLTFDLPEEFTELRDCLYVGQYLGAFSDVCNAMRTEWKHGEGTLKVADFYDDKLFDILGSWDISREMIGF